LSTDIPEEPHPVSSEEIIIKKRRNVRRRALIVGINEYDDPANSLSGCVADAQDVAETLKILEFPASRIKMLLDGQATAKGILKGLDWLVKGAQAGDVLVFSYSGHGSYVVDLDNDEKDSRDEILCSCDIDFDDPATYVTDDQLFESFTKKCPAGVRCDVFLDSCFSGSATRSLIKKDVDVYKPAEVQKFKRQRFMPPPVNHQFRANSMIPMFTQTKPIGHSVVTKEIEQVTQNNCLWSGCQEYQYSEETVFDDQVRGAFTYYLMKILRASNGNITRGQAYSILRSTIANEGFEQIPNLELPSYDALNIIPLRKASQIDTQAELEEQKEQKKRK